MSYPGFSLVGGSYLPLCRDAVGVFYSPSRLGCHLEKVGSSFYIMLEALAKEKMLTPGTIFAPREGHFFGGSSL